MIDRKIAPTIRDVEEINFLTPKKVLIDNQLPFYSLENTGSDAVKLDLYFSAGTIVNNPLVANFTAGLLFSGSSTKSSEEIHNEIDDLGGFVDINVSHEYAILSLYSLNSQLLELLRVVLSALENVTFPEGEVKELLKDRKKKLKVNLGKVNYLAQIELQKRLFKGTLYGKTIELNDFDTINRALIQDFYDTYYRKGINKVSLIGNVNDEDTNAIHALLGPWYKKKIIPKSMTFNPEKGVFHVEKAGALQSGIRVAKIMFDKHHADYHGFNVMNTIFGDYFGSRLMKNIREDKGYTYGIGSMLAEIYQNGYFAIMTQVGKKFVDPTLDEIKKEMDKMRNELVGEQELTMVRNYLMGQSLKAADGPFSMMDLFLQVEVADLDYSFYNRAIQVLKTITPQEIKALAKKYLIWDEMLVITAGQQLN